MAKRSSLPPLNNGKPNARRRYDELCAMKTPPKPGMREHVAKIGTIVTKTAPWTGWNTRDNIWVRKITDASGNVTQVQMRDRTYGITVRGKTTQDCVRRLAIERRKSPKWNVSFG